MTWPPPPAIPAARRAGPPGPVPTCRSSAAGPGADPGAPGPASRPALLALFLALFTNAVAHSVLVSGQERLDGLNASVEQEQADNQRLHLRAAAPGVTPTASSRRPRSWA